MKMIFDVLTIFPEMIEEAAGHSILARAVQNGLIGINAINIRDFAENKHKKVDDTPYGGGDGMVMACQPVFDAYNSILQSTVAENKPRPKVYYMSPQGQVLTQRKLREIAQEEHIVLLCGHYEGIDERIIEGIVDEELSIGDYVLTGGELPAMVLVDCLSRFIPGVLGSADSAENESFTDGLLEYPQYTRPSEYAGLGVPEVLLNGNHALINKWRREQALALTRERRPELLDSVELSAADRKFLAQYEREHNKE